MNARKEFHKASEFEEKIVGLIISQKVFDFFIVQGDLILIRYDIKSKIVLLHRIANRAKLLVSITIFVCHVIKVRLFNALNLSLYYSPHLFEVFNVLRKAFLFEFFFVPN